MRFFYTDDPKGKYTGPAYEDLNANKIWSRHRYNWYVLTQMISLSDNFKEKQELREELSICERKLAWSEKHPNFYIEGASAILLSEYKLKI